VTSDPTTTGEAISPTLRRREWVSELGIVALAAIVGVLAALVVIAMNAGAQAMHELIFRIAPGQNLSTSTNVAPVLALLGPALGGLVFGLLSWLAMRRATGQPVDPIEANALHGGRMSLKDSAIVAVQTMFSSGVGASVGLEAGYTQASSGLASRLGQLFHVRRADLRLLVGCGAGAAIGTAFNAPLMGAFYGFELILGTYAIPAFVPMMTASFTATITRQMLQPNVHPLLSDFTAPGMNDLPAVLLLGVVCGLVGIVVMRGATLVEAGFRRSKLPVYLRPAIGGLIVGGLALFSPAVLSAGHGAVYHYLATDSALVVVGLLLVAKVTASSVSIGSGFRGGLFFASLLMGVMAGQAFAATLALFAPEMVISRNIYALVGMSSLAVAVVGGPMTMTLLALEMTGDLKLTLAVLAASGAASFVTRRLFGFSFTTWRFHLRGETIRGPHDIGWLRDMTVGSLMRREVPQLDAITSLKEARLACPPGSTSYLIATEHGRYAGMVRAEALFDPAPSGDATLRVLLVHTGEVLRPDMTILAALDVFERTEADCLAVVSSDGTPVGVLSEAHAVRHYSEEMARRLGEFTGERR